MGGQLILSTVSIGEAAGIATVAAALVTVGTWVGHVMAVPRQERKRKRESEETEKETVKQLTWAVAGKPADQWGPREPGLIEQMTNLRKEFEGHVDGHNDLHLTQSRKGNLL